MCPASACTVASPRKVAPLPTTTGQLRLPQAQEALRRQGLRLLARLIVRAYLKDRTAATGPGRDAAPSDVEPASSREADRRAR